MNASHTSLNLICSMCPVQQYLCSYSSKYDKKAVLPQGNRAMPQVFFSVEVRQQHSLQA